MVTLRSSQEQLERDPKIEGKLAWYWILPAKSGEESVLVGMVDSRGLRLHTVLPKLATTCAPLTVGVDME